MFSIIGQILAGLARCGAAIAEHLNLPEVRRKGAAKAEAAAQAAEADTEGATAKAVYSGDEADVNGQLSKLLPAIAVFLVCGLLCGCGRTVSVVYVPSDRHVVPMTSTNGVAGWFVPNATFNDLLKAAQRAKDLERQQAVTARMEGTR